MTPRIEGPVVAHRIDWGWLRTPLGDPGVVVGDRLVPSVIEVDFPGADGQPSLGMLIEVIDGVPRCTELHLTRADGGRELRPRDLSAIQIDKWVEDFVALCSGVILNGPPGTTAAALRDDTETIQAGMRTIRDIRKGSRRPMTGERRQRVADVYNAHESGGIGAVERAFHVSRSTAIRYIKAARDAGLITKTER